MNKYRIEILYGTKWVMLFENKNISFCRGYLCASQYLYPKPALRIVRQCDNMQIEYSREETAVEKGMITNLTCALTLEKFAQDAWHKAYELRNRYKHGME